MFDVFKNRLELEGTLTTVTALRISQGRSIEPDSSDLPVVKDALGRPLIPGASFKGALRSRLESMVRGINPSLALDPSELVSRVMNEQVKRLKEQHKDNDVELTKQLNTMTDTVSKLFGAPWQASKIQIRDLTVKPETWFGQFQERDGVSIVRDTETAADKKLYDYQVVPANVQFYFKSVVENAKDWELGLLMLGLYQLESEQIQLGGGVSRGLGVVRLEDLTLRFFDARNNENPSQADPNKVLAYIKEIAGVDLDKTVYDIVSEEKRDQWIQSLIQYLEQNSVSTVNSQDLEQVGER